jgi:RNA polymerase sigma factor (sigma-70 family)
VNETELEDLLRRLAPQVLGAVVRRYGNFDLAEDATQGALVAAALQWPRDGQPSNPKGWLITAASRRLIDLLRNDQARRRREERVAHWAVADPHSDRDDRPEEHDDKFVLLLMCCHPSLSTASQIALTLRAVGGLTTAEIARALLVSEETATRRITRAKESIGRSGVPFAVPPLGEYHQRLDAVLRVLYLMFNEGYASTAGPELQRIELAVESIRLARFVHDLLPEYSEATGLLALMLLTNARHLARTALDGSLIPMAEQDRTKWD